MITAQIANELTRKKNNMRQLRWIERAIKSAIRSGEYNFVGMGTLAPCVKSHLEQLGYYVEITDTRKNDLVYGYAMYEIRWDNC